MENCFPCPWNSLPETIASNQWIIGDRGSILLKRLILIVLQGCCMCQDLIIKWKEKLNLEQNWIKGNKILNVAKVQMSHKRRKKTCSRKIVDKNKVFLTDANKSACNCSEFHILNSNASFTDFLWML